MKSARKIVGIRVTEPAATRIAFTARGGKSRSRWYFALLRRPDGLVSIYNWTAAQPVLVEGGEFRLRDFSRLLVTAAAADFGRGALKLPLERRSVTPPTAKRVAAIKRRCRAIDLHREEQVATGLKRKQRTLLRFGKKNPFVAVYHPKRKMLQVVSTSFAIQSLLEAARFLLADSVMESVAPWAWISMLQPGTNLARRGEQIPAAVHDPRWTSRYKSVAKTPASSRSKAAPRVLSATTAAPRAKRAARIASRKGGNLMNKKPVAQRAPRATARKVTRHDAAELLLREIRGLRRDLQKGIAELCGVVRSVKTAVNAARAPRKLRAIPGGAAVHQMTPRAAASA